MNARPMNVRAAAVALCGSLVTALPATAHGATQWPQMLGNPAHTSHVVDSQISASNAASFGVKWMANLYSPYLGSPVVAFNQKLNKTLVYVGNERGDVYAIDAANGQIIWSMNLGYGDAVRATPAVAPGGSVWVGTNFNPTLYKLDGATGQVQCSAKSPSGTAIMGSPMIAAPPGGTPNVYWDAIDNDEIGPIVGTNIASCTQLFNTQIDSGSWVTPAYGVNGAGEPLVLLGSADPDDVESAVDAVTGKIVWAFPTYMTGRGWDIGQAATVSAPGVNGFANGVAYVTSEYGDETAIDMNTGKALWVHFVYPSTYKAKRYIISSAALAGNKLVFGYNTGVLALNATTGDQLWNWPGTPGGIDSSPAIVGPTGNEVVAFGDLTGAFRLLSLNSGSPLYSYPTGGYIVSSPAESSGTFFIASSDGFLYAMAPGGSNGAKPQSGITSPASGSVQTNPNGSITISGSASDASGVSAVEVAVQSGGPSGSWYNAAANTWNSAPVRNSATLANPGAASTSWSFSLPVPAGGGTYRVSANAVNASHLVEKGSAASFSVKPSKNQPTVKVEDALVPPGGTAMASGGAFKPGETVTFSLLGENVATAVVGSTGGVPSTAIPVSSTAPFGSTALTLSGNTSGKSATTTLSIMNAWTQYGYSSYRTSYEPNDEVISHTIFVGAPILTMDWMYNSGSAINTSPAVIGNTAYFGNDGGVLSAVNVNTGAPQWTYSVPSGAAIHSSPAIDGQNRVIFGADDGKLYVVNKNGASVATIALSGKLGPPAVASGHIVIASDNGMVYVLKLSDLSTVWSKNAGAPITAAPAYDAQAGRVIVGTSTGKIVAYGAYGGLLQWSKTVGGGVNSIALGKNVVYAGSADGHMYALDEATGTQKLAISGDGGAVTAVGVNTKNNPTFATAKGNMYDYQADGSLRFQRTYGTAGIVGLGGAGIDFFGPTTDGGIGMIRTTDGSWHYNASTTFGAPPVVFNGMLLTGGHDGNLYAFTPTGYTPPSTTSVKVGNAVVTIDGSGNNCSTP